MLSKKEEDSIVRSAIHDIYSGVLGHFRDSLNNGGFPSADRFVKEILPYLNLMLERIDEELEMAKKEYSQQEGKPRSIFKELFNEEGTLKVHKKLEKVSDKISKVQKDLAQGRPEIHRERLNEPMEKEREERRTPARIEPGKRTSPRIVSEKMEKKQERVETVSKNSALVAVDTKVKGHDRRYAQQHYQIQQKEMNAQRMESHQASVKGGKVSGHSQYGVPQSMGSPQAPVKGGKVSGHSQYGVSQRMGSPQAPVKGGKVSGHSQYGAPQRMGSSQVAVQGGKVSGHSQYGDTQRMGSPQVAVQGGKVSGHTQYEPSQQQEPAQMATQSTEVSSYSRYGSPQNQEPPATGSQNEEKVCRPPNNAYTPASVPGGGRYASESLEEHDICIPEETSTYTPKKIDNFIRYSNLHRERGNYDEAIKFLEMAKEMPEYFMYRFYRDEILALEDNIERSRNQGVSFVKVNARETKFSGFDYISGKGTTKTWHEEDDF